MDHVALLRRTRADLEASATVIVISCLDACEHSNVVVVLPAEAGAAAGEVPTWISHVNTQALTSDLADWIGSGDPRIDAAPVLVELAQFTPTRQSRRELDEVLLPRRRRRT